MLEVSNVSSVPHSSLTQDDITKLPKYRATIPDAQTDSYESENKSSTLKKTIFGLVAIAAIIVGLKHLGKNSFLKFDENSTKFLDKIKKYTMKSADLIEKPFVSAYNTVKGWFPKKAAVETPVA